MKFYIDEESFEAPYLASLNEARSEFANAGRRVKGANARAEKAHRALEALKHFRNEVTLMRREENFEQLRRLRDLYWRPIGFFRHLTIGEWRGIFLVGPASAVVVCAAFSRKPHNYHERLGELQARHESKFKRAKIEIAPLQGKKKWWFR